MIKNRNLEKLLDEKKALIEDRKKTISKDFDFVLMEAENYFQISTKDIKSDSRKKEFVEPRHFCYYILRKLGYTLKETSGLFNRHHATIIYGVNKLCEIRELCDKGWCGQDERNIIDKADEVIAKTWNVHHENKAA
jgi:chromosomal replication initiation ATPase DnaA